MGDFGVLSLTLFALLIWWLPSSHVQHFYVGTLEALELVMSNTRAE